MQGQPRLRCTTLAPSPTSPSDAQAERQLRRVRAKYDSDKEADRVWVAGVEKTAEEVRMLPVDRPTLVRA